jgi:hypothetical protein
MNFLLEIVQLTFVLCFFMRKILLFGTLLLLVFILLNLSTK